MVDIILQYSHSDNAQTWLASSSLRLSSASNVLWNGVVDCDRLLSILAGGGAGGVKSLSFLFPNPADMSVICAGSLAACISCVGLPLRLLAIEIALLRSICIWFRLIACEAGRGGV